MSEKKTSQAQQSPVGMWAQAAEAQVTRIQAFYDQLARYEGEGTERAMQAVDEMARLTKEAFEQSARLSAEWRRLTFEAVQKSADLARTGH